MADRSDLVLEIKSTVNQILRLVRAIPGRRSGLTADLSLRGYRFS